jgi:ketosteroid isomerase-like protein
MQSIGYWGRPEGGVIRAAPAAVLASTLDCNLERGPTMSNTETVRAIYEAFGRGDVPAILALLADDVDWNNDRVYSRECPWNGNFQGKANIPGFFQAVGENLTLGVFNPHTFVAEGDHVMVMLRVEGTSTRTASRS